MRRKTVHHNPGYISFLERIIISAGRRVARDDPELLAELVRMHAVLDEAIQTAVDGQRSTGITWQSIGECTGTSKQAAIKKWLHPANA